MIRAYKQFRKKFSFIKHEKLLEDTGQDPIVEGVTFYVRYLGSCFVLNPSGDEATGDAIKSIVSMARKTDRKLHRVALMVSMKDVKMTDLETGNVYFDISIYRITYCSADAIFSHVFAFITMNKDDSMECHAFLCRKRKIAQAATMTIAQAFNLAFREWKNSQEKTKEDASKEKPPSDTTSEHEMFLKMKHTTTNGEHVDDQKLLIDLNSPGDGLEDDSASKSLVQIDISDTDEMNEEFSKIPQTPSNIPILKKLPPNASSLSVGAFLGSQSLFDTPLDSPLHGASLTPGQLMTPASSPMPQPRRMSDLSFKQSPLASPKLVM